MAENPTGYSDPDLAEYTDELAQDVLEKVIQHMPIVLPAMAFLNIFMLALIAAWMT